MAEKNPFREKIAAQLKIIDADMRKLRAQVRKARASQRIDYTKKLQELRTRRSGLRKRFRDARTATEGAAHDLKRGGRNVVVDLRNTFHRMASRFR